MEREWSGNTQGCSFLCSSFISYSCRGGRASYRSCLCLAVRVVISSTLALCRAHSSLQWTQRQKRQTSACLIISLRNRKKCRFHEDKQKNRWNLVILQQVITLKTNFYCFFLFYVLKKTSLIQHLKVTMSDSSLQFPHGFLFKAIFCKQNKCLASSNFITLSMTYLLPKNTPHNDLSIWQKASLHAEQK